MKEKDLIFICKKCGHNIYVSLDKIRKLLKTECPACGEEAYDLWILSYEGHYVDDNKLH